jgi:hypothetical protein
LSACLIAAEMKIISRHSFKRPIQPVVLNNQELAAMKEQEAAFYVQVQRGIVLWKVEDELAA